ncbi:hypothetical protein HYDPIDRAFT_27305 [Hydnomerulius pinastri MD-312]|nr:hypothetical protein HYDPIDRAFT_27305 [Hydnomerulius pinastri MD-312]
MSLFPPPITTEILSHSFPPSLSERVQFKKQLAAFHDEVTTLQARIVELNSHINVMKHNLSLARVLALDVLYEIFDRWLARDREAPLTAIRVCRRWREGILAYPQAWRRIDIQPIKHCPERVAFWVKCAGDCALNMRVHIFPEVCPSTFEVDLQRHIAFRTAFTELCKTSHCWDRLTILMGPGRGSYEETIIRTLQSVSDSLNAVKKSLLPRIQSTAQVFCFPGRSGVKFRDHLLGGTLVFPNSAQKSFVYLGLPLEDSFTSNTLRSVTIGKCSYDSIAQVTRLLSNLPALQVFNILYLDIEAGEPAAQDNPYIHRTLTEFNFADFGSEYSECMLLLLGCRLLTLPNLRRLFLSYIYYKAHDWDVGKVEREVLIDFLERSRAPLEALHLPTYLFNDEWLYRILSLSPQLKSLTIRIQGCSNAPRELLASFGPTAHVLCPDLEHLTLIGCSTEHMDLIHELARTRHQFLEGRSASGVTANTQMMLRPFRSLHVYGPPEVIGRAGEIEEMMPAGTFSFSIERAETGQTPHEIMEQALFRPEWDRDF